MHNTRNYRQLQCYRESSHLTIHCYTHECPWSIKISTIRFLVTGFNTGIIIVSLSYTLEISWNYSICKIFSHSQTSNSTEMHSIILMPQFLSSIPPLPSSYPGRLASRNSTDTKSSFLLSHLRLPSQKTSSILFQLLEILVI
jgi:hypothetical protein